MKTKEELINGIKEGNTFALSKAITLAESSLDEQRMVALELIEHFGPQEESIRIGITGAPGVGKSTLIEALGKHILSVDKQRVAVLSVDPSSAKTKGSILGDKTRMSFLSNHPNAFVRPTSSGSQLGGLAKDTRLAMLLCEAAGFDYIIIESVGVGQGEIEISHLTDVSVLLLNPVGGDELQGIKKGIVESVDIVAVNKADNDLQHNAQQTAKQYENAIALLKPSNMGKVHLVSGLEHIGVSELFDVIVGFYAKNQTSGEARKRRLEQMKYWTKRTLIDILTSRIIQDEKTITDAISQGKLPERIAIDLSNA